MGRFINADELVSTGQGLLGNNMFAYCRNNPVKRKDASGMDDVCVTHADEDNNPLNDFGSISGGGGYANAYNSIDAGYHYGVDFSMAANSSLTTGGIYGNGYTSYGVYSTPTGSGYSSTSMTSECFAAGTLVQSEDGAKTIEDISVGDNVWAWDEKTGEVSLKRVVETYINEADELFHVFVNGEEIISTPTHPFYSPVKGWTAACKLRAGDILVLVNGEYVVVEKIQHEILEAPIAVYNFQVEGFHTYYVTELGVLVHNTCHTKNTTTEWNINYNSKGQTKVSYNGKQMTAQYDGTYYWLDDMAGHGGSQYKVFTKSGNYLYWYRDADRYGNFIYGKHKGETRIQQRGRNYGSRNVGNDSTYGRLLQQWYHQCQYQECNRRNPW